MSQANPEERGRSQEPEEGTRIRRPGGAAPRARDRVVDVVDRAFAVRDLATEITGRVPAGASELEFEVSVGLFDTGVPATFPVTDITVATAGGTTYLSARMLGLLALHVARGGVTTPASCFGKQFRLRFAAPVAVPLAPEGPVWLRLKVPAASAVFPELSSYPLKVVVRARVGPRAGPVGAWIAARGSAAAEEGHLILPLPGRQFLLQVPEAALGSALTAGAGFVRRLVHLIARSTYDFLLELEADHGYFAFFETDEPVDHLRLSPPAPVTQLLELAQGYAIRPAESGGGRRQAHLEAPLLDAERPVPAWARGVIAYVGRYSPLFEYGAVDPLDEFYWLLESGATLGLQTLAGERWGPLWPPHMLRQLPLALDRWRQLGTPPASMLDLITEAYIAGGLEPGSPPQAVADHPYHYDWECWYLPLAAGTRGIRVIPRFDAPDVRVFYYFTSEPGPRVELAPASLVVGIPAWATHVLAQVPLTPGTNFAVQRNEPLVTWPGRPVDPLAASFARGLATAFRADSIGIRYDAEAYETLRSATVLLDAATFQQLRVGWGPYEPGLGGDLRPSFAYPQVAFVGGVERGGDQ